MNVTRPDKLLLWDIDGTLVSTGRAGEFALEDSIRANFGEAPDLGGVEIAGRTDRAIAMQVICKYGREPNLENVARFLDGYVNALARRLPERKPFGTVYAGITSILDEVQRRPDLAQGLLTGNIHRGAKLKLEHYDVFHYFEFGAFADDHHDRNALPPFARARAEARYEVEFPPHRIFVIGDTPHDVACGKAIGARTIAVATGRFSIDELRACGADAVFADFSDTAAFFAFIDGPGS
jgi:phosphoglycolate phosphatase